ncbi:MAG TPA: ABC transporter permease [Nitrospiria bacterium]|jgi:phospholipid/cholesterol/gamma-HCH transport system permease protein
MHWLELLGAQTSFFFEEIGRISRLFWDSLRLSFIPPLNLRLIIKQMENIGVNSIPVVLITAISTGMVLALQSYNGFRRFNAESLVGTVVALSMTRELGPVLTGLIVAGRAGASMAAELGTMKVTEQVDALTTMAVNPIKYLIVPRVISAIIMLPVLTIFSDLIGITGGYFVSVQVLDVNPTIYLRRTTDFLELGDIYGGILKALVFGLIISTISCYKGFNTEGGAEGVGRATTGAVVISSMLILISDYFLTAILF